MGMIATLKLNAHPATADAGQHEKFLYECGRA